MPPKMMQCYPSALQELPTEGGAGEPSFTSPYGRFTGPTSAVQVIHYTQSCLGVLVGSALPWENGFNHAPGFVCWCALSSSSWRDATYTNWQMSMWQKCSKVTQISHSSCKARRLQLLRQLLDWAKDWSRDPQNEAWWNSTKVEAQVIHWLMGLCVSLMLRDDQKYWVVPSHTHLSVLEENRDGSMAGQYHGEKLLLATGGGLVHILMSWTVQTVCKVQSSTCQDV